MQPWFRSGKGVLAFSSFLGESRATSLTPGKHLRTRRCRPGKVTRRADARGRRERGEQRPGRGDGRVREAGSRVRPRARGLDFHSRQDELPRKRRLGTAGVRGLAAPPGRHRGGGTATSCVPIRGPKGNPMSSPFPASGSFLGPRSRPLRPSSQPAGCVSDRSREGSLLSRTPCDKVGPTQIMGGTSLLKALDLPPVCRASCHRGHISRSWRWGCGPLRAALPATGAIKPTKTGRSISKRGREPATEEKPVPKLAEAGVGGAGSRLLPSRASCAPHRLAEQGRGDTARGPRVPSLIGEPLLKAGVPAAVTAKVGVTRNSFLPLPGHHGHHGKARSLLLSVP